MNERGGKKDVTIGKRKGQHKDLYIGKREQRCLVKKREKGSRVVWSFPREEENRACRRRQDEGRHFPPFLNEKREKKSSNLRPCFTQKERAETTTTYYY